MALLLFVLLQLGDVLSTLLFLQRGVAEANPLIAAALRTAAPPAISLAVAKLAGCAIAVYAWKTRRTTFLKRANLMFAACVAWNVAAVALS